MGHSDEDDVPDFADGIDLHGNGQADSCRKFDPMIVDFLQSSSARLVFRYDASNPTNIQRQIDSGGDARYSLPDNKMIRIWKKDGPSVRNPHPVQEGGDFIQPGYPYTAQELGKTGDAPVTLYVEVVGQTDRLPISVEFYKTGNTNSTPTSIDTVKIEAYFHTVGNRG